MLLTFTREEFSNYSPGPDIHFTSCWGYTIYQGDEILGYFLFSLSRSYISFSGKRYLLKKRYRFFSKSEHPIIDLDTNEKAAIELSLPDSTGLFQKPYTVKTDNELFMLHSESPDIRFRLFNRDTWGCQKFSIASGHNKITYQGKTHRPAIYSSPTTNGTIDASPGNFLLIAAGLYLREQSIANLG
jgi:hypothetical protein